MWQILPQWNLEAIKPDKLSKNLIDNINKTMQNKIKHLKADKVALNGIIYKPYTICSLPPKFGTDEITTWFNYKGYTYIAE